MTISRFSREGLRPTELRVLEHVHRLLDGHKLELVGSVSASILLEAIMLLHENADLAEIEESIDSLAATLKLLARLQRESSGASLN